VKAPQWARWGKRATVMAVCFPWAEAENEPFARETQPSRDDTGGGIQRYIGRCFRDASQEL